MYDLYAPLHNAIGTVKGVDDKGQIQVDWDNGSSLSLVYGLDKFRVLSIPCTQEEIQHIKAKYKVKHLYMRHNDTYQIVNSGYLSRAMCGGAGGVCHRLLRHVLGAGHMGAAFRVVPQSCAGQDDVGLYFRIVDGMFYTDLFIPFAQRIFGQPWYFLDLRSHLSVRLAVLRAAAARDQGQESGGDE